MRAQELRHRRNHWRAGVALAAAAAVGVGWLVTAPLRGTGEQVYTPETDAYVSTAHPDANYGTTPTLRTDATPKIRSYLRFRLRGLPGRVVSARLRLWSRSGDLTGYSVHRVASTAWDELGITSNNAPAPGDAVATSGPFGAGLWSTTDVTRLVQGTQEVTLALTTRSPKDVTFESREGSHKPELVVETAPTAQPASGPALAPTIENVADATAARYGTRDDHGMPMETLKVIASPGGGYLGIYHATSRGVAAVRVATSSDLLHWRYRTTLDRHASRPTIAALSDGGFAVAAEADGPPGRWLRFRYYATLATLLQAVPARTFDAPRTLAPARRGAEGTPNIYQATLSPDLTHSSIEVGFHYRKDGVADRQARGVLTGFAKWASKAQPEVDAALHHQQGKGHVGDRDHVSYQGAELDLVEGRAAADQPRRVYLYEPASRQAQLLDVKTRKGSRAFANPTVTSLRGPSGAQAVLVTLFLPASGAAPGEAGELVYYKEHGPRSASPDPVVAGAGDIACRPGEPAKATTCRQQATANLLARIQPTGVLALGDLQYEQGLKSAFEQVYDHTWGRLKAITHPVPGNHEDLSGSSGYFRYFGPAAGDPAKGWYSYDIGTWHLVALNSNCKQAGGCGPGSPQERWLRADLAAHPNRCTLAYWHHPRFSSGLHGSNGRYDAFWRALHAAGADVVINAHDHSYERFAPQTPGARFDRARGIRQFVVGTGGRSLRGFRRLRANSVARNANTFGVLALTLHATGYDWRFVPVKAGRFADRGSGSCH